jgi:hypothetical protein
MLQKAPNDRWDRPERDTASDEQTLPAKAERRPQDDDKRRQGMQPIGGGQGSADRLVSRLPPPDRARSDRAGVALWSGDARAPLCGCCGGRQIEMVVSGARR